NENGRNEPPVLMIEMNEVVGLGAEGQQNFFGERSPKNRGLHSARFPHEHEDKEVRDQKNNGEDVRTRKHCPRITHRVTFVQRQRRRRSSEQRRFTNLATLFTRANQRTTIAADARAAHITFLFVRQSFLESLRDALTASWPGLE
ncbi:MAG: hypothetical protein QOF72_2570, partial [Blastocatellia bacterium]|nr:hypothetical protein [Blastocatellia bacterium]